MRNILQDRISIANQLLVSVVAVCCVAVTCFFLPGFMSHRVVALILLVTVSLIAVSFDILPVLVSACLSAFIWNFFFIPPRFTFHVSTTDDAILFAMYFMIAMINGVLTHKIRQVQKIARKKEERANTIRLYNTLLNSLSHELRTPISTIIGATDTLQTNHLVLTKNERLELLDEISTASFRLNQQVENLLNMSRLQSGIIKPKKDWCDITELVHGIVKRVEERKYSQDITININPELPLFKVDKGMLEQIIYNLLNNACIYTAPNSHIYVTAQCLGNLLQIEVEDNGDGFPQDEIDRVFEKFYRLHNTTTGGTGLGLSIVKGFTEAMGGTVKLVNVKPKGALFVISIPTETTGVNKKAELWLRRKY